MKKNVLNTHRDKNRNIMTELSLKIKNENQSKVQIIYFELSFVFAALMILIHSVSFFAGISENLFAYKIAADTFLSAVCITAEYIFIHKTNLKNEIKKYVLCFLLWIILSANLIIFSLNVPCLIVSSAFIYLSSFFADKKFTIVSTALCLVSTAFTYLKHITISENDILYYSIIILAVFMLEIFSCFVVCILNRQNSLTMHKIISQIDEQKKDILSLNHEVIDIQETVILSVAEIIEAKSPQTGQHVKRVSEYVKLLCTELGYSKNETERIRIASMLHDIGKLSIPAEIIEKKGRFTPEEYEIMKTHVTEGEKILSKTPGYTMELARIIALQHHERWDGSGYLGMKGNQIDKISRIVAVADVFDALVSSRSYKKSWPPEKVYDYIVSESGTHFDPWVVDAFKKCYDKMVETLHKFPENLVTK
ncbi:MAG: HD-GYP domain-containing protein [Ruminococcus callidus]|nr:HD-GYP domain-containing protein [Ruminococcus callidus]